MRKTARRIDGETLRARLKVKHFETKNAFLEKYPGLDLSHLREHSATLIGAGLVAGSLLLSPPSIKALPSPQEIIEKLTSPKKGKENPPPKNLQDELERVLPQRVRPLNRDEEKILEQIFLNVIGIPAKATLEGEHLNTTYGLIGAEQHLRRYPGDRLYNHGEKKIIKAGMAPGLGAWGYFAPSAQELTSYLEEVEKWYAVVQTLYLPDWKKRLPYLRDWYKYRKVLIVNTQNGNALVAAIADSGPAAWTGKHFGGSPEVMHYLGGPRYKKGAVVLFFVDDPENKIPLGPVEYNRL